MTSITVYSITVLNILIKQVTYDLVFVFRLIADLSGLDRLRKTLGKAVFFYRNGLTQDMLNNIHAVGPEFLGDILKQA